ncbi:MAG: VWA domain-containing protein, partial [Planctomycetes bacterium]|nr:VWA domain-containing protein [Planctomycetota bacterium]
MFKAYNASALVTSMLVHIVLLFTFWLIRIGVIQADPKILVDSIFTEERIQQEFSQEIIETKLAENISNISGGKISTNVSSAASRALPTVKVEESNTLKDPEVTFNLSDITAPANDILGDDLGGEEIQGESAQVVEGYGPAMSQLAQEVMRLMRTQRVLIVWLFDESESMKDDQKEIRQQFHKIYEDLRLVQTEAAKQDKRLRKKDILMTSIIGFGKGIHPITPKPTSDIVEIRTAIDKIAIDDSGKENLCATLSATIDKFGKMARGQKQKLAIVVVTDESGDDGRMVEQALDKAKRANASIYILGRESVFGYPFARVRWRDPKYNLSFWLTINRGPETPFPECLQWNGLHARWDVHNAGFGPYEQVRLAKETNGIFFVLPGEEENLAGRGAQDRRKYHFLDMKEYEPSLQSRRDYRQERASSEFRRTLWNVIVALNPNKHEQLPKNDPLLNIRQLHYSVNLQEFRSQAAQEAGKAARAMVLLNQVIPTLEKLQPLRDKESSERWRANYDLIKAQCIAFRVRLFQYLLAMDQHANANPPPKPAMNSRAKKMDNEW